MEQLSRWGSELVSAMQAALQNLLAYLPVVLLAAVLIVVGWLLARVMRKLSIRAIERLDWTFRKDTAKSPAEADEIRRAIARPVSALVYWTVFLSFGAAALKSLGWPVVEVWTADLITYLPVLVGGIAIIVLGFIGGSLARHIIEPAAASAGIAQSAAFGRLGQVAIIATGVVIGSGQLGIDVTLIVQLTTVIVGVTLAGLALALALGVREHLSNLIGIRYVRKHYQIGDHVRSGNFEGRIIEIADGCLFLEAEQGDVSIPGSSFTREPVVKVTVEVSHER